MALSDEAHRRRRQRGFWGKLRNPRTLKAVLYTACIIHRLVRWFVEIFGSPD